MLLELETDTLQEVIDTNEKVAVAEVQKIGYRKNRYYFCCCRCRKVSRISKISKCK